jgi:hypothetical protein
MATEDSAVDSGALMRPFEPSQIRQRPGPGKRPFSYISGPAVIDRLLVATGSAFSWKVDKVELITQETGEGPVSYWVVLGSLSIAGMGIRAGIGTHPAESVEAAKAAETDALKRAAVKFGVGLHLYEEESGVGNVSAGRNGYDRRSNGNGHANSPARPVTAGYGNGNRGAGRASPPSPPYDDGNDPFA